MDQVSQCSYQFEEMRCTLEPLPETDRCAKHPHDGGSAPQPATPGPSSPPRSTFDRVKDFLALKNIVELGVQGWKWIEEHLPDLAGVFGVITAEQLALVHQLSTESDVARRERAVTQLMRTLSDTQVLLLVGLIASASTASQRAEPRSASDA